MIIKVTVYITKDHLTFEIIFAIALVILMFPITILFKDNVNIINIIFIITVLYIAIIFHLHVFLPVKR